MAADENSSPMPGNRPSCVTPGARQSTQDLDSSKGCARRAPTRRPPSARAASLADGRRRGGDRRPLIQSNARARR
eukprot:6645710-Prymnesium_polylepis.1